MENPKGSKLDKQMILGVSTPQGIVKDYTLLRSNGVAEQVFTDKSQTKPYTWMGKVISIAVNNIGNVEIAGKCRADFLKSETFTIPPIVNAIPLADASSMVTEIHRTVWKHIIRQARVICDHCGQSMDIDIDLRRIVLLEEDVKLLHSQDSWEHIVIDVPYGWKFESPRVVGSQADPYESYKGVEFNRFVIRMPTLGDAIKNEQLFLDSITFWRKMAFDCLVSIQAITPLTDDQYDEFDNKGTRVKEFAAGRTVIAEMPSELKNVLGMKIFNECLDVKDLAEIRVGLRDEIPTLPFWYEEDCANPTCRKTTAVTVEANDFFSA
jgi:hypothetical protein